MKWSEAFAILENHCMGRYSVCAEHDIIYIDIQRSDIKDEDWAKLEEFGFHEDEDYGVCIYV